MDIGDAFGAFCEYLEKADRELIEAGEFPTGEQMIAGPGFTVTISSAWDLFDWSRSEQRDF